MRVALIIILGILFLVGAILDWIQFMDELEDMRSEDGEKEDEQGSHDDWRAAE